MPNWAVWFSSKTVHECSRNCSDGINTTWIGACLRFNHPLDLWERGSIEWITKQRARLPGDQEILCGLAGQGFLLPLALTGNLQAPSQSILFSEVLQILKSPSAQMKANGERNLNRFLLK